MVLQKSSLKNRNVFSITCLKCYWTHNIAPSIVESHGRIVKIYGMKGFYIFSCRCGERFNVQLDFRKKSRRPLEASAFYTVLTRDNAEDRLKLIEDDSYRIRINSSIQNISVDGIGFVTNTKHTIKPSDELIVKFILLRSGKEQSIRKRVIVRAVSEKYIGAEFFPREKNDPKIGFYLLEEEADNDDLFI